MNAREKILGRIREALQVPAPKPGAAHSAQPLPSRSHTQGEVLSPTSRAREWLPKVGSSRDDVFAAFQKMADDLKAKVVVVPDKAGMVEAVRTISKAERWETFATHTGQLTTDTLAKEFGIPVLLTDKSYDPTALEKCAAGVTQCTALVAQTGSVLVTAVSAGGRALSVLPPHHVVVARRSQLVPDLPAALAILRSKFPVHQPSFISFITGPSRTGDIERILVLGAHGPKQLTIVVIDSE